jgi:hypothetical protein
MLGLEVDAIAHKITFAPHLPADWTTVSINNLRVGADRVRLTYRKTVEGIFLEVGRTEGRDECTVEFQPAMSLRAIASRAELNGKRVEMRKNVNTEDQHVSLSFSVKNEKTLVQLFVQKDFAIVAPLDLPPLGGKSAGLRVLAETWSASRDELRVEVSGAADREYELKTWGAEQISQVEGASIRKQADGTTLAVKMPGAASDGYSKTRIVIRLADVTSKGKE